MDKVSKQRSIDQRRSNVTFQDSKNDNAGSKRCNRLGCSTRYISSTVAESSDKAKLKSSTISSSDRKSSSRNSPKNSSSTISVRKLKEQKKLTSFRERAIAESNTNKIYQKHKHEQESSGVHLEMENGTVLGARGSGILCRVSEETDSDSFDEFCVDACGSSESSSQSANLRSDKDSSRKTVTNIRNGPPSYPTPRIKKTFQNSSRVNGASVDCSARNLTRKSTFDFASSSSSSSIYGPNKGNSSRKESSPAVETSTSRGQARVSSSIRGRLGPRSSGLDCQLPQSPSGRTRNQPNSKYNAPATRSETTDRDTRMRLHLLGGSSNGSSVTNRESITRRPGYANARTRPVARPDHDDSREQLLHDRDMRIINIDGIAQLLLALEMIEQQDEQLSAALGYHDQHRDMRLDIDNMSYEELLALGDKMGTVSTALSEEKLSKCVKQTTYGSTSKGANDSNSSEYDTKCSICQEEYVERDDVGILVVCEHLYHLDCIHQWLRQKNWCPVCKASASPSP